MNNAVRGKKNGKFEKQPSTKTGNEKDHLKWISKPSFVAKNV